MKAIKWRRFENIEALLQLGACVWSYDYDGNLVNCLPALIEDVRTLELFINRGMDFDIQNNVS